MRPPVPLVAAAMFVLLALSGCSGNAPAPTTDPVASGAQDLDLKATDTTGVIRGVVVDDAIRPVVGATVTLQGTPPQTTKTNDQGAFGFDGLPAATYFITVHKIGYADTQQSAEVVAGVKDPAVLKVLLVAKPGQLPSFDVFHFAGFLECNVAAPFIFHPCQVDGTPATDPVVVGNDNFAASYNLTGNISWIHVSLVWDATEPVGTELYYNVFPDPSDDGTTCDNCWIGGPSPLVKDISGADTEAFQKAGIVAIEVSGNGEQGLAGAELEQSFNAYIVVFHNFTPPEGYAYYRDGEPVPPQ